MFFFLNGWWPSFWDEVLMGLMGLPPAEGNHLAVLAFDSGRFSILDMWLWCFLGSYACILKVSYIDSAVRGIWELSTCAQKMYCSSLVGNLNSSMACRMRSYIPSSTTQVDSEHGHGTFGTLAIRMSMESLYHLTVEPWSTEENEPRRKRVPWERTPRSDGGRGRKEDLLQGTRTVQQNDMKWCVYMMHYGYIDCRYRSQTYPTHINILKQLREQCYEHTSIPPHPGRWTLLLCSSRGGAGNSQPQLLGVAWVEDAGDLAHRSSHSPLHQLAGHPAAGPDGHFLVYTCTLALRPMDIDMWGKRMGICWSWSCR